MLKQDLYTIPTLFFSLLSFSEKRFLIKNSIHLPFLKGEMVYRENCPAKGIYFLKSGFVTTYKENFETSGISGSTYTPGEYFGYDFLQTIKKQTTTAETLTNSVLLFIPEHVFLKLTNNSFVLLSKMTTAIEREFTKVAADRCK